MSFADASSIAPVSQSRWRAEIPEGWQQGRGAFGGLVLGVLCRAMEAAEPERATRTLTGDLCGPVLPGAAEIEVVELRRGSNQTNLRATLTQQGAVLATATAVLSKPRAVT
ncbi:MAG TPA: acyl-CoA thioesterase domain-containing protein, partial [Ideonella sp.]|nr:acyl-CoA thioesterase domain-containing protein [Ideonella sp.]